MWIFLSLGTAFCAGTSDALSKKALETERVGLVAWVRTAWGSLFLIPLMYFGTPPHDAALFWRTIACAVPLELVGAFAFQSALRSSPISACIPFMAFTPVFLLLTGWTFLGERPTRLGVAGVLLVAAGAFLLYQRRGKSAGSPKGPLLVLLVSFIYSVTSIFAKKALMASSPMYFCGAYYGAVALGLFPFQWTSRTWTTDLIRRPGLFAAIGALEACSFLFQFNAFMVGDVAYVLAIKRLSLLLSVLYGRILFGEREMKARVTGAGIMVAGAILIALA